MEEELKGTKEEVALKLEGAIKTVNVSRVRAILSHPVYKTLINEKFKPFPHQTPLHLACSECQTEMIKLLLEFGAEINTQDGDGWTCLHYVAICSSVSLGTVLRNLDLLIQRRDIILSKKTSEETSVLHYLVRYVRPTEPHDVGLYLHILNTMLQRGVELNGQNQYGETPLHYASLRGNREATLFLLKNKANVNAINCAQETPLHYAARNGRSEIAKILMANGADLNMRSVDGTPYDLAALRVETQKVIKDELDAFANLVKLMNSIDMENIKILKTVSEAFFSYLEEADILSLEDKLDLFLNVAEIIRINEEITKELQNASCITEILFVKLSRYLNLWAEYVKNLLKSLQALQKCKKKPNFYEILRKKEAAEGASLKELLQFPVHRLISSPHFLEELLSLASKNINKYEMMENSIHQIKDAVNQYNEKINEFEESEKQEEEVIKEELKRLEREKQEELENKFVTFDIPPLQFLSINGWDTWWASENKEK